jgi:hypothetical protein
MLEFPYGNSLIKILFSPNSFIFSRVIQAHISVIVIIFTTGGFSRVMQITE